MDMGVYQGEIYAVLSGLFWAVAVCFFKRGGANMPAITLNLFKNIIGIILFAITLLIVGQPLFIDVPNSDYLIVIASGIVGMTLADTLFFAALRRMGASMWAIVSSLYSPSVILMAYVFLDETLSGTDLLGVAIVVGAIILASTRRDELGALDKESLIGVLLSVLSLLLMAVGIIIMKPVLLRTPALWATQIRLIGSTVSLFILVVLSKKRRVLLRAMLPDANWKYLVPGSLIGPYLALGFWIAGFKYALAGKASILNQLNMVFIFVFAWLFLKEPLTWRRSLGLGLALGGASLVILF